MKSDGWARAEAVIAARVRRRPVEVYEASVALEAWGGVRAGEAFDVAASLVGASVVRDVPRVDQTPRERPADAAGFASVLLVPAVVWLAGPIAAALGIAFATLAWLLLPFVLAVSAAVGARYREGPGKRLLGFRSDAPLVWIPLTAVAALAALAALATTSGTTPFIVAATLLTVAACVLLIARGWSAIGALVAVGAGAALALGVDAALALIFAACVAMAVVAVAWRTSGDSLYGKPNPARRAVGAGTTGALLGFVLVADPGVVHVGSAGLALALLPSALASYWSTFGLADLNRAIEEAAVGTNPDAPARLVWRIVRRYVAATVVLSALVAFVVPSAALIVLLPGVALAGLLTASTAVLGSITLVGAGLACAAFGAAVAVALAAAGVPSGGPMAVGAAVGSVAAFAGLRHAFARPAALLASRISIP